MSASPQEPESSSQSAQKATRSKEDFVEASQEDVVEASREVPKPNSQSNRQSTHSDRDMVEALFVRCDSNAHGPGLGRSKVEGCTFKKFFIPENVKEWALSDISVRIGHPLYVLPVDYEKYISENILAFCFKGPYLEGESCAASPTTKCDGRNDAIKAFFRCCRPNNDVGNVPQRWEKPGAVVVMRRDYLPLSHCFLNWVSMFCGHGLNNAFREARRALTGRISMSNEAKLDLRAHITPQSFLIFMTEFKIPESEENRSLKRLEAQKSLP
ncbi:MAG: hypothetical protein Q9160_004963 [Pyrenula sp. 1 TL-2023]